MKYYLLLFVIIAFLFSIYESDKSGSDAYSTSANEDERYVGEWVSGSTAEISKILVKNKIKGCGQMGYKIALDSKSEFMVRCTENGESWLYYLIFTGTSEVVGPSKIPYSK